MHPLHPAAYGPAECVWFVWHYYDYRKLEYNFST